MGKGKNTGDGLSTGQKVYVFASGSRGKQVGTGECYDLADEALKRAGAKSASDYGEVTRDGDYTWGKEVELHTAQQGDILQFRNNKVTIVTVTRTRKTSPDGSWKEATNTHTRESSRGHHTAIVVSNNGSGGLVVLEQHVRGLGQKRVSLRVQQNTILTKDSDADPVKTVHMEGKVKVEVETKTTVKVEGTIKAYRPEVEAAD